ncbi:MAG: DUF885 family protein [Armatimonadetes bacterium]|nr:DUF885 family protein [Armatimonadota bacterium]
MATELRRLGFSSVGEAVGWFDQDWRDLDRQGGGRWSAWGRVRLTELLDRWQDGLPGLLAEAEAPDDRADLVLLSRTVAARRRGLELEARQWTEIAPLLPGLAPVIGLQDARRRHEPADPKGDARLLSDAGAALAAARVALQGEAPRPAPHVAHRAAGAAEAVADALRSWYDFRAGYDPEMVWWAAKPHEQLQTALTDHAAALRRAAEPASGHGIVGDPVGRDELVRQLDDAMIPLSPEALIAAADRAMEWCLAEMARAALDMGIGDDRRAALERVKGIHGPPGSQPGLIRDLAFEAIETVEQGDLLSVPPVARDGWLMEMMTAEEQKANPFFLGGDTIRVSYPTSDMDHGSKLMSLRANNRPFARATVHHELVPGHHMQAYYARRTRPYRRLFYNPFWTEGWALHWEMLLWDRGFAATPEERVGMLFWRSHRCARVAFSLRFHMGLMSADECIAMLVDGVGHEPSTAEAEVRRSFRGDYPPLYQCAYLVGAWQVQALRREALAAGWTDRAFHDAFLRGNSMPVAMARRLLLGLPIEDAPEPWRFGIEETQ